MYIGEQSSEGLYGCLMWMCIEWGCILLHENALARTGKSDLNLEGEENNEVNRLRLDTSQTADRRTDKYDQTRIKIPDVYNVIYAHTSPVYSVLGLFFRSYIYLFFSFRLFF